MRNRISDAPLTDVKTEQDGETECGCWEFKYVSAGAACGVCFTFPAGPGRSGETRASGAGALTSCGWRVSVRASVCDSEWKEATSTLPAQPGVTNNHTRSLRCLVCYEIMSQEPKIHLGMTVIVVELGAKEMARTVVEHKVKKKKKSGGGTKRL